MNEGPAYRFGREGQISAEEGERKEEREKYEQFLGILSKCTKVVLDTCTEGLSNIRNGSKEERLQTYNMRLSTVDSNNTGTPSDP